MKQASMALAFIAVLSLFGGAAAQATQADTVPAVPAPAFLLQPAPAACSEPAPLNLSMFLEDECTTSICRDPCRDACQSVGCRSYCVSLVDCTCDCECA